MKIGIVTWFEYENYGTKLQAVALQHVLRCFGHKVYLLNFKPKTGKIERPLISKIGNRIAGYVKENRMTRVYHKYETELKKKEYMMSQFITSHCNLTEEILDDEKYITTCNSFDLLIFGSDQIWNQVDFHPYYFGGFDLIKTPKVSYAPSFGTGMLFEKNIDKYYNMLSSFMYLTAREDSGVNIIKNQLGLDATRVVDPTMLLSGAEWKEYLSINDKKDNYVFCYLLGDNQKHYNEARKFAEFHGCNLIIVPGSYNAYFNDSHIKIADDPRSFLEMLNGASYVITDSFHALVFSLLFEKEFFVFYRFKGSTSNNENTRISQLVEEYKLNNRVVNYNGSISNNIEALDYLYIRKRIIMAKNESINELKKMISLL